VKEKTACTWKNYISRISNAFYVSFQVMKHIRSVLVVSNIVQNNNVYTFYILKRSTPTSYNSDNLDTSIIIHFYNQINGCKRSDCRNVSINNCLITRCGFFMAEDSICSFLAFLYFFTLAFCFHCYVYKCSLTIHNVFIVFYIRWKLNCESAE